MKNSLFLGYSLLRKQFFSQDKSILQTPFDYFNEVYVRDNLTAKSALNDFIAQHEGKRTTLCIFTTYTMVIWQQGQGNAVTDDCGANSDKRSSPLVHLSTGCQI